jgi:membrane protein YqaA with SNARE-associated domain
VNGLDAAPGLAFGLIGAGLASGLVPVINAETLLAAAVAGTPQAWFALALAITAGQCTSKVVIYLTARDGPERLRRSRRVEALVERVLAPDRPRSRACTRRPRRGWAPVMHHLKRPIAGTILVTTSALIGLPPLAIVSGLAGVARLRLTLFIPACVAGRLTRFALIAWPIAHTFETLRP